LSFWGYKNEKDAGKSLLPLIDFAKEKVRCLKTRRHHLFLQHELGGTYETLFASFMLV
jgi:hypothetical protein